MCVLVCVSVSLPVLPAAQRLTQMPSQIDEATWTCFGTSGRLVSRLTHRGSRSVFGSQTSCGRLELRCHRCVASFFGSFSSAARSPDSRPLLPVCTDDDSIVHRVRATGLRSVCQTVPSRPVGNLTTTRWLESCPH